MTKMVPNTRGTTFLGPIVYRLPTGITTTTTTSTSLNAVAVSLPSSSSPSLPLPVRFSNPLLLPPPVPFGYLPLSLLYRFLLLSLATLAGVLPQQLSNQRLAFKPLAYLFLRFLATLYLTRIFLQELLLRPSLADHPYLPTRISAFSSNLPADVHYLLQTPRQDAASSSKTVHLSHGFGASSLSFISVIPSLSSRLGATVVASDAMGFGFSRYPPGHPSTSEDYSVERSAALASENLRRAVEGAGEGDHLFVGHSMGAGQALRMAREKILGGKGGGVKVVLVSPAILERRGKKVVAKGGNKGLARLVCSPFIPVFSFFLRRLVSSGRFWKKGLAQAWGDGSKVTDEEVNLYRYPSVGKGWERGLLKFTAAQARGEGRFVAEGGRGGDGELLLEVCKACDEVVILHGKKDGIVPVRNSRNLKKWVEEEGGELRLVELEGVGHVAHEEVAEEFVKFCQDFM
ncbi:hypothetical protein TrCOL_g10873 [Triparma columacea]|uniref:AB hydrolase-1 domain-containing protein n=1 Tax=Triparma columacea TaxID=722753 RepID=A0A9W7L561_9STRA|nr:hypothetical protein TrCOL_g10873 [Triparma columacea]